MKSQSRIIHSYFQKLIKEKILKIETLPVKNRSERLKKRTVPLKTCFGLDYSIYQNTRCEAYFINHLLWALKGYNKPDSKQNKS